MSNYLGKQPPNAVVFYGDKDAEIDRLREQYEEANAANLRLSDAIAAERESLHHERLSTAKAEVERDELRALLREAREYVAVVGDSMEADYAIDVLVRIDAALRGGGDE